ncbi:MAG TPA: cyclic nucleotide-binding domain-containing protein, partial [Longimicrobiales bacterium]
MTTSIRALEIFEPLPDPIIEDIERSSELQQWRQRSVLFHEGDECQGMQVVVNGSIQLYRDHDGKEQIVMIQG